MRASLNIPNRTRRGMTLIEALIVVVLLAGAAAIVTEGTSSSVRLSESLSVDSAASLDTARALRVVRTELRAAAFVEVAGEQYPLVAPAVAGAFGAAAFVHATPADPEGVSTDCVYLHPADANGDGWPDVDADHQPVYDPIERALLVVPGRDGLDTLELRTADGQRRVLARRVVRFRVERPEDTGFAIPIGAVRVTLEVERRTRSGRPVRSALAEVVRLVNGARAE